MISDFLKVLIPTFLSFAIGIGITPTLTHYMYRYRLWKRRARKLEASQDPSDVMSDEFKRINNDIEETSTPRVGGVIIWLSVILTVLMVWCISKILPSTSSIKLDFLSRSQTWLPIAALITGAFIGLVNDFMDIFGKKGKFINGFPRNYLIGLVTGIGAIMACWFYFKLGVMAISIPFFGSFFLGWLFIPLFIFVTLGIFSSGVIDGIDGLAGGVMAVIFGALGAIAYFQHQIDIAALAFVITSGILAFLWFNIPPARFWMGETGMLGLAFALTTIVFITDSVLVFPIIALPLVATSLSSFIQIISKKYFHRKVFLVAPLHHHFQARGWSREKITMRYWILSIIFATLGVILKLLG